MTILPRRKFIAGFSAAVACGAVVFPRSKSGRRYHTPYIVKLGCRPIGSGRIQLVKGLTEVAHELNPVRT